eukprot:CAMPEP_0174716880 /NCGR_PEP_ID=MMETSP1094-20130205/25064_1 /TAXON_ID=156173 /ORGANISM="Chrysochromulina brevifilum, Strain UTEX LB 985" /LENGTH=245 /DNA_ID=CAMNT_0015916737 /DNA_START=22 /DNA_END=759 /DNA_ORIENTATION=+
MASQVLGTAIKVFGTAIGTSILLPLVETQVAKVLLPSLYATGVAGLPKAFGITIAVTAASAFWLTMYGFSVSGARKKYMELAKKDGEKDCEERYSLPNLYVEGNTKYAKAFNCHQRSHQQAFETLPQFYLFTFSVAFVFPLTAAFNVGLWLYGRMKWSKGYAGSDGDPSKRYDHPLAFLIFASFMSQFLLTLIAATEITGLLPIVRELIFPSTAAAAPAVAFAAPSVAEVAATVADQAVPVAAAP